MLSSQISKSLSSCPSFWNTGCLPHCLTSSKRLEVEQDWEIIHGVINKYPAWELEHPSFFGSKAQTVRDRLDHVSTFQITVDYANARHFAGQPETALALYRQSHAGLLAKRGNEHSGTQSAKLHLARVLLLEGRGGEALSPARATWTYFHKKSPDSLSAGLAKTVYGTALLFEDPNSTEGRALLDDGAAHLAKLPASTDPFLETATRIKALLELNP